MARRRLKLLLAAAVLPAAIGAYAISGCSSAPARGPALSELDTAELDARAAEDVKVLEAYSQSARRLIVLIGKKSAIWDRPADKPLSVDERRQVLDIFEQVLAYCVALDTLSGWHSDFWRIALVADARRHARHFAIGWAAYCQQLRLGLAFVDRTIAKPQFETLLDEGSPEHGLGKGAYAKLKWNVVHVADVGRVFASRQYHNFLSISAYGDVKKNDTTMVPVLEEAERCYADVEGRLASFGGARLFADNGLDILKDTGHSAWFPIQANVAELMGHTRVKRWKGALITDPQIEEAAKKCQPGDIVVERRNWFLSNIGLPGFWPHATLWLGSRAELAAFLDQDPEVVKAYGGPFTKFLEKTWPEAWKNYAAPSEEEGAPHRVIEAVSKGVIFTSAEHSLHADYAAAMRPRLSKLDVARAIERAFGYWGRPYDFDFDFYSDATLVCSELVWKSYEPGRGARGLNLPLVSVVGRMTLPPNTMIAQFDREYGTKEQQLDFVWFLDGKEKTRSAEWADVSALRASHTRVKWDILQD